MGPIAPIEPQSQLLLQLLLQISENQKQILQDQAKTNERLQELEHDLKSVIKTQNLIFMQSPLTNGTTQPSHSDIVTFKSPHITQEMKTEIFNQLKQKTLTYWGECVHFVLQRPDIFGPIIFWDDDETSTDFLIRDEDSLFEILAALNGNNVLACQKTMSSRVYTRNTKKPHFKQVETKEGNKINYMYYRNKIKDYDKTKLEAPKICSKKETVSQQNSNKRPASSSTSSTSSTSHSIQLNKRQRTKNWIKIE